MGQVFHGREGDLWMRGFMGAVLHGNCLHPVILSELAIKMGDSDDFA